jgi:hypothetical protein
MNAGCRAFDGARLTGEHATQIARLARYLPASSRLASEPDSHTPGRVQPGNQG